MENTGRYLTVTTLSAGWHRIEELSSRALGLEPDAEAVP